MTTSIKENPDKKNKKSSTGRRHNDKLTAILRTAAELFSNQGYEATSLDMIADQLGMHKATLYHYIKNKEYILHQCLIRSFDDIENVMEAVRDRKSPVIDRLKLFAQRLAAAQNSDFGRCLVLVGSRPLEGSAYDDIRAFQRRLDQTVRDLITEGIADGSIKPCHPELFSSLFFGALNWVPRWYNPNGKLSLDKITDNFMDTLLFGISKKK